MRAAGGYGIAPARMDRDARLKGFHALDATKLSADRVPHAGSTERLTPAGCRGRLNRFQHAMASHGVVECRAEMGSFAIVAGETRIRLGDVGARSLRWAPTLPAACSRKARAAP